MNLFYVDIIGMISNIDECKIFYNKYKGKCCFKRDIMVTDEDASIILTLWEKQVIIYNFCGGTMLFSS